MPQIIVGKKRLTRGKLIGQGGEGSVYTIEGHPNLAVKEYKESLRKTREEKVRAMVLGKLATKLDLVSYPSELALNDRGHFLGFVMRLVSDYQPLHELYSPKSRKKNFQKADYRFIVNSALNVARAIGQVHKSGCVIGDLNHSGVLVAQDSTVALIDADSFQYKANGRVFPCVVGVPEFTPPELHGTKFSSVVRTIDHDNFGLAVAIFHLLFMGRHPYAGTYNGPDTSLGVAIANNRFAYSRIRQHSTKTKPPIGALTLDLFPDKIAEAFELAFGVNPKTRPGAHHWIKILQEFKNSLTHCNKVKTHYYPSKSARCVWCVFTEKYGSDMFPNLAEVMPETLNAIRGTKQAINDIATFQLPTAIDILPRLAPVHGKSDDVKEAKSKKREQLIIGMVLIAAAVSGFAIAADGWFVWAILGFAGISLAMNQEVNVAPFQQKFNNADSKIDVELNSYARQNGLFELMQLHSDLQYTVDQYRQHDNLLARELAIMKSNRESQQKTDYLDRFSVRKANIPGIGPAKTASLISFNIETAADVNYSAVKAVPGIGDVMAKKLVAWKRKHESKFRFTSTQTTQDIQNERALRSKFAGEKTRMESTIVKGMSDLNSAKKRLNDLSIKARTHTPLVNAIKERAQAEHSLKLLEAPIPQSNVKINFTPTKRPSTTQFPTTRPRNFSTSKVVTPYPACPKCNATMRLRKSRYGQFWGCSSFPTCQGKRKL